MENAQIFSFASSTALVGWVILLLSPFFPRVTEWLSGRIIPVVLSVGYTALVMVFWTSADGGFGSLDDVMTLFQQPEIALAGWIHYLAFDLFIGAWECRTARAEKIPFWLVLPCLPLTFMFGPVGLLLFVTFRAINRVRFNPDEGATAI
ncbi:ABA4-like family protein [Parasphingorhabdus sp.]|uniref:ABA4-like family protein n=1 Tax=Parasphingorhabdus sp. TaxID=2709688 RepID=UPI003BAE41AF